ncbi:MAG: hypothetical protein CO096_04990 [Armatimonadetes bacterium CG_4_9_14_3_um_filter_66_14]|nr:MAG: hypothetical protein COZ57_24305 [Armatimonadetes bacterium CG_4_8_14_3_um_filter_66_20]PJB73827.1 MAG: hypothetical protein CO096_04990 [Armatimonadetes bacterium CG_4_9_14_3_um_filter_66_14]
MNGPLRFALSALLGIGVVGLATAETAPSLPKAPLRLPNGEPLVCIYYFGHWWDPWKSDDDAIRRDFKRLRDMGFTAICVDHEWSQAIDGNWKWLDREHRLAKEAGLGMVPWLSLKTWSDVDGEQRLKLAKEWYGVEIRLGENQDGSLAPPLIYDDSVIEFGARYACDYLKRYQDQALLRLAWNGKSQPVISLSVESAWNGSFDEETNRRFRDWLKKQYGTIGAVNGAWHTDYRDFDAVDPKDKAVFDYAAHPDGKAKPPRAVEEHVAFRSQTLSDSLARMADRVREQYPDVLFLAEIPYQYGSKHPHAVGYRIGYGADPSSCDYADIVLFRNTGPLNAEEAAALREAEARTGQKFVLTYRTYSDWDVTPDSPNFAKSVEADAGQAAALAHGFGFYSWNEMVDVHVAYAPSPPKDVGWTEVRADRAIRLLGAMTKRYRELVGTTQ